MNVYEEKSIRIILKEIHDLYIDVRDLIFTTYNFDPDFFEENIVTYLMGNDRKIHTIAELNETNKWIKEHGVSVYYDKGALSKSSSCVTLPVYPQYISTGVFHPKVIVVYGRLQNGKESAHLIVSSCNLTVSGYGHNQEVFSCIQVKSDQVAKSLLGFLDKLCDGDGDRHWDVRYFLRNGKFNNSNSIEFFWNYGNTGMSLVSHFSQFPRGNMKIVSPYFDEDGPKSLLDEIGEKDLVHIFPAVDGENYNIYHSDYENLTDEGIVFSELEKTVGADGSKRFIHAKIISKGNYVCIGSYNFTSAAMRQKNAEAALIFKYDEEPLFVSADIDEELFLKDEKVIDNKDEIAMSFNQIFVSVTVDWSKDKMFIDADIPNDNCNYRMFIEGLQNHEGWEIKNTSGEGDIAIDLDSVVIKTLLRHKQFSVYKDNTLCFNGLINELNWMGVRPEIGCESLDETIAEWMQYSSKNSKGHIYDLKCISEEDAITEQLIGGNTDPEIDIFDNYYLVSRALGFLLNEIRSNVIEAQKECPVTRKTKRYREWNAAVQKSEENLYGILYAWPGSMAQILQFVEKGEKDNEKKQDVVYAWLICKYLKEGLKLIPKKLNRIELFEGKRKDFARCINKADKRFKEKISADVSKEYIHWIEKELFKEVRNV